MVSLAFSLFLVQAKMRHSILRGKKKKSYRDRVSSISKRYPFVIADSRLCNVNSLELYRRNCDLCMLPVKRGPVMRALGRLVTYVNADKIVHLRYLAELALDLYNDKMVFEQAISCINNSDYLFILCFVMQFFFYWLQFRSFKLKKVCKINRGGGGFYWLTFRAREHGGEEYPFRGVVRMVGGRRALFCEIKEDDKITLLPWDDDYVSSEQACES